jgi:hypothetical protein
MKNNIMECFNDPFNKIISDSYGGAMNDIPKVIYQTHNSYIPPKVYENIKKYAPDYEHIIYDSDDKCVEFLSAYFNPIVRDTFEGLKLGAHKADLFRYCLLYIKGGIYLDIKTELIKPVSHIFKNKYFYTALTSDKDIIYQGVLAAPPRHHIFPILINYIVEVYSKYKNVHGYNLFLLHFTKTLTHIVGAKLHFGLNREQYYLFEEHVIRKRSECKNPDRYQLCSTIRDKGGVIMNTRYHDFPWKNI